MLGGVNLHEAQNYTPLKQKNYPESCPLTGGLYLPKGGGRRCKIITAHHPLHFTVSWCKDRAEYGTFVPNQASSSWARASANIELSDI